MIEINLLPKDYRKSSRSFSLGKTGLYLMAGGAGAIFIMVAITFWQVTQLSKLRSDIDRANQRAEMLRQDIRVVDALMDVKDKIHRRIDAVEKLDRHRSTWVRILEDLSGNVPEFVWLDEFKELPVATPDQDNQAKGKNKNAKKEEAKPAKPVEAPALPSVRPVELRGFAFTLNALAATMIRMMRSDYFDNVELVDSYDTLYNDTKAYKFELSANVHYLSDEELRQMVAQTADTAAGKPSHASLD
jgi:Tfp pilus assembly protein PilN